MRNGSVFILGWLVVGLANGEDLPTRRGPRRWHRRGTGGATVSSLDARCGGDSTARLGGTARDPDRGEGDETPGHI